MNNKKHLALAISAIIFSGAANAALDMNDATADVATFASEIVVAVAPATTLLEENGTTFDAIHDIGFGISDTAVRFFRYDLDNGATFVANPVLALTSAPTADATIVLSSGGAGESFVIFQVTANVNLVITRNMTLKPGDINVTSQSTVNITYSHFETGTAAVNNNTTPLSSASENIIQFSPSLTLTCTPETSPDKIDVATSSIFFDGAASDATTVIGDFTVGFTANLMANGIALNDADDIIDGTATSVTVSGSNGWSAITGLADTTNAFLLVGTDYVDTAVPLSGYSGGLTFTATADGTNPIASSAITITVAATAEAGYTADTATGLCVLGEMTKNGSSDRLTFLLKPNAGFKNFIRITNPSSTGGNIFLTVTDDNGVMATLPLSDVAGQAAMLAAGASTDLININDLATAAVAAEATFDASGKMRLDVDAEFGKNAGITIVGGAGVSGNGETAVNVQAFSMSKDSNAFFMMQKD